MIEFLYENSQQYKHLAVNYEQIQETNKSEVSKSSKNTDNVICQYTILQYFLE